MMSQRQWLLPSALGLAVMAAVYAQSWDGKIVQYGKMREAIGQQQHQARVSIQDVVARPHFFGVAALAGLKGEAAIVDGQVIATEVNAQRQLQPVSAASAQATLLVGSYVSEWVQPVRLDRDIAPAEVEGFLASAAAEVGLEATLPYPYCIEGEFLEVRLHVIHGACPMHARLNKQDLARDVQPYEGEFPTMRGTVVGVYAENSVGNLTHPGTSLHSHLVFTDPRSGLKVTGHVERLGIRSGSQLRLPKR